MSFEPLNESASREPFDNSNNGFNLSADQVIQDGVLKLKGTPVVAPNPDLNWQEANWSETSSFRQYPTRASPGALWDHNATAPWVTSDLAQGLFPFSVVSPRTQAYLTEEKQVPFFGGPKARRALRTREPTILDPGHQAGSAGRTGKIGKQLLGRRRIDHVGSSVLKLDALAGQTNYIQQNTSESQSFWPDNVDNATGWTAEFRVFIPDDGTSEMVFDDGDIRVGLHVDREGIVMETSAQSGGGTRVLRVPWGKDFHKVRVAAQGNNVFFLGEHGQSFVGTSYLTAVPSVAKDLKIGFFGETTGTLLIDYFHQSHLGVFLDVEDDIYYNVSLNEATTQTPSLKHASRVSQFRAAVIKTVGPYDGGTAKVQTQYKNTSNPSWTNFGAPVTLAYPLQEISLTGLNTDADGSDEVRFALSQQAFETSSRPPSFEEITVLTDFDGLPEFKCVPDHGNAEGGNTVSLIALNGNNLSGPLTVYVSGVAIPAQDIQLVSASEVIVSNWPAGAPGPVTVSIDTLGPAYLFADRPYRYVESYTRVIDRAAQIARVCGTRSPFRIKNEVPNGEVNLAYVSAPGVEANSHVGLIDLSYIESGNIVTGSGQPVLLDGSALVVPGSTFTYEDPPGTEDLAIAVGAAGWRSLGVPAPLFYYHVIGKGRYYVRKEQDTLSLSELRDSISVHYQNGTPVSLEDFPWDIVVTQKDIHGNTLPDNNYLVLLLTNKKYIPGKSVFVTATVADPSNGMRLIQGYTEVVNTAPMFTRSTSGNLRFEVDVSTHGEFTLRIVAK